VTVTVTGTDTVSSEKTVVVLTTVTGRVTVTSRMLVLVAVSVTVIGTVRGSPFIPSAGVVTTRTA
jgi:hypothetical protein